MIPPPLLWTLLTVLLWTSGSSQIQQQETAKVLYPKILSTEDVDCDCSNIMCDLVSWYRSVSSHSKMQFLGKCNNADRATYGPGVDRKRFILKRRSSSSFSLRIINVTEEDAGVYFWVYSYAKNGTKTGMWKPGILLRPGVTPPTLPPETKSKTPVKSVCRCPKKKPSQDGCGSLSLWPLVGLAAALALALICTLYYFSRLPKKCRHQFVKRR
ncbi:T-cell surface glycoprotein CD8 beta chain [Pempheris klunzingeri]|uniref:T-cell surface glycoprotein CD8 beta chain n=1 Tax=Pempheris klunzingeri TaxID=3127111 RepID=UPI00398076EC